MSGASSSAAGWSSRLEHLERPTDLLCRPDDPRLGEIVEFWRGDPAALQPGRAVIVGFPQDEGVRRNHGRPGAADAPREIRRCLYRLTPWDPASNHDLGDHPPLDAGDIRMTGSLEQSQQALGEVVAGILKARAIPVVIGGGHETAYGHYLGYVAAGRKVGVINVDAHLDVRPLVGGQATSGTPFRQMLEDPRSPLTPAHYICLGVQPHSTAREHYLEARQRGCVVLGANQVKHALASRFAHQRDVIAAAGCQVYLSIDADAVRSADVPAVSAANPTGISGEEVVACARLAGQSIQVASFELVEINPRLETDGRSSRWAAVVLWNFLVGVLSRRG
jgi:formiminoglutamase